MLCAAIQALPKVSTIPASVGGWVFEVDLTRGPLISELPLAKLPSVQDFEADAMEFF